MCKIKHKNTSNNKVCIFSFFVGKLPPIFQLCLKQYGKNQHVDFLFFVDDIEQMSNFAIPKNVFLHHLTETILKEIEDFIGVKVNNYLDVCGLKPVFGDFFQYIIKDYLFWGWIDYDVILSKLDENYFDDDYDVITIRKHFLYGPICLFKNIDWINKMWKNSEINMNSYYKKNKTTYGYEENPLCFMPSINKLNPKIKYGSDIICVGGDFEIILSNGELYHENSKINCLIADSIIKFFRFFDMNKYKVEYFNDNENFTIKCIGSEKGISTNVIIDIIQ
jgi:hypothetical protein